MQNELSALLKQFSLSVEFVQWLHFFVLTFSNLYCLFFLNMRRRSLIQPKNTYILSSNSNQSFQQSDIILLDRICIIKRKFYNLYLYIFSFMNLKKCRKRSISLTFVLLIFQQYGKTVSPCFGDCDQRRKLKWIFWCKIFCSFFIFFGWLLLQIAACNR